MAEKKACKQCRKEFEVADDDLTFLDKISPEFAGKKYQIPPPTLCSDCRFQRLYAFRDERKLYNRQSDLDGAPMISIYSPDKKFKVYPIDDWWSDKWDATEYGRDFNPSENFFKQFAELSAKIPRMQSSNYGNENCPFVNRCSNCKNCYLCFNADQTEDSLHCDIAHKLKNCVDCSGSKEMEFCYNCVESLRCFKSNNLWQCSNLAESDYCFDCHSGSNLILCHNLRNKNYCIRNKELSKEEFLKEKEKLNLISAKSRAKLMEELLEITREKAIHKFTNILKSENCSGNNIFNSKNCQECFEVMRGENLTRVQSVDNDAKDARDSSNVWDGAELVYESTSVNKYQIIFSLNTWHSRNMTYCELCDSCQDCFGSIGLKHKQYCILNKQYSRNEYEKLAAKIIEKMIENKQWGEFFPMKMSDFGFNESFGMDYYPMTKPKAEKLEVNWQDQNYDPEFSGEFYVPKDNIGEYINSGEEREKALSQAIKCSVSERPFKIMPQELAFYIENKIPLPTKHYEERFKDRFTIKNPRRLWHRKCTNEGCNNEFETTYAPDRPEKVYCESCYQKSVI